MWGLGRGGGGVLKGMPPPEKQGGGGDCEAGPSLSCEEGEGAAGALGAGLLAAGWNSSVAARGWSAMGPGLRGLVSAPAPASFPSLAATRFQEIVLSFLTAGSPRQMDGSVHGCVGGVCVCFDCADRRSRAQAHEQTHAHGQALG